MTWLRIRLEYRILVTFWRRYGWYRRQFLKNFVAALEDK